MDHIQFETLQMTIVFSAIGAGILANGFLLKAVGILMLVLAVVFVVGYVFWAFWEFLSQKYRELTR